MLRSKQMIAPNISQTVAPQQACLRWWSRVCPFPANQSHFSDSRNLPLPVLVKVVIEFWSTVLGVANAPCRLTNRQ